METAYDLKDLGLRLKKHGLELAETETKHVIHEVFGWLKESAVKSSTPIDDVASIVYPQVEAAILVQADKIDGITGN